MFKSVKTKVIIVSVFTGLILIGILSFLYLNSVLQLKNIVNMSSEVENMMKNSLISVVIIISTCIFSTILISLYLSHCVICPKYKFIKCDERTELKHKLNEVSSKKNQIETILLHMTDGIIAFNMEGEIILINSAAKKFLSISPEDNNFYDIFGKFQLDINMEKVIYLENWTSTEQRIQVGDKYVKVLFAPFKNEEDRPDGVIAVIQDITEHVKLDNMQKELVADVSHELKTPITSIMGYADTLLEGGYDTETQTKFLNVIATESRRMAKLVTDLLTLSRYDTNKNNTNKEVFDLGDLVRKCQEKLAIEIKKKGHIVSSFVTADVPPVYAGKIFDNGMGIPEEDLNRIFERFYRVDKARTREMGGTGLGLSIAKEILDKNGGSIDIKSKVGEGTEVVIRIPTKQ